MVGATTDAVVAAVEGVTPSPSGHGAVQLEARRSKCEGCGNRRGGSKRSYCTTSKRLELKTVLGGQMLAERESRGIAEGVL